MREQKLHTICEDAHCPNIGECWNAGTATFMILGDVCTRACGFCAVRDRQAALARPAGARAAGAQLCEPRSGLCRRSLRSIAMTSLIGGAEIFAACIEAIRRDVPAVRVEVLIPDFKGNWDALATVVEARPVRPQPQRRNGAAALLASAATGALRALARLDSPRQGRRPGHAHEVRLHGRTRRDPETSCSS